MHSTELLLLFMRIYRQRPFYICNIKMLTDYAIASYFSIYKILQNQKIPMPYRAQGVKNTK